MISVYSIHLYIIMEGETKKKKDDEDDYGDYDDEDDEVKNGEEVDDSAPDYIEPIMIAKY